MTYESNGTTLGIFASTHDAVRAVEALNSTGIPKQSLSIIVRDDEKAKDLTAETGVKTAKGAAAGAGIGAIAGGLAGLALATSAVVLPGIGAVLIAGPLAATLGIGGAAAGAAAGGVVGTMVGLGASNEEAAKYEEAVRKGDVLLGVATNDDNSAGVERTLEAHSARSVKTVSKELSDVHVPRVSNTSMP